jgi:DNA-binding transcriptional LysR family regulator
VRPAQLGPEPFILPQGGCEPLIRAIFRAAGITPCVQFEVRDMATIFAMVQEELGVTLVPALALPLTPVGVRALPLDPPVQRPIGLVVRSRDAASPAVTAFIQQARTWAKAHGYGRE